MKFGDVVVVGEAIRPGDPPPATAVKGTLFGFSQMHGNACMVRTAAGHVVYGKESGLLTPDGPYLERMEDPFQ